jgi:hypothetical protein
LILKLTRFPGCRVWEREVSLSIWNMGLASTEMGRLQRSRFVIEDADGGPNGRYPTERDTRQHFGERSELKIFGI